MNNIGYLKLIKIKYAFSFTFNLVRIEYLFGFYENNYLIFPSDLVLYKNLSFFCYMEISNDIKIVINSYPNIYQNNYYKCVEYYKINEKVNFGIIINGNNEKKKNGREKIYLFNEALFNYNNFCYKNDNLFDFYIINEKYKSLFKMLEDKKINRTLKLKKSYIRYPYLLLKRNAVKDINIWKFENIFIDYFCFCKGINCLNSKKEIQQCKYYYYLSIIELNKNLYTKTDFLFVDFIFSELSSDDAYPVFKEMWHQKLPVHYITENMKIYNEFCYKKSKCLSIIYVNKENYTINGDFLEKYLTLVLQLKNVISGGGIYFNYINNLFYNIEYITYISITHGVCYFKYFLYEDFACYGTKRIDKILIPPSDKIISLVKNFGWKDEDIIKINLPKWDKYNKNNNLYILENISSYKTTSIFIFFTWRQMNKNKQISPLYFINIMRILKYRPLIESLKNNNVTLYFTLHHKIDYYKIYLNIFKKYEYLELIEENKISQCLLRTSLVLTDFSSIIFDLIYRRKPFIIYIPDIATHNLREIYNKNYYDLIQSIKNGTIEFENKYLDIKEAVNKIIFYINNNFTLDSNLKIFYDNLQIKEEENNTNKFIKYLKNINNY